jgi:hypothetical protein
MFIVADTLPSMRWVVRAFWNDRKKMNLKKMRLKGDSSEVGRRLFPKCSTPIPKPS